MAGSKLKSVRSLLKEELIHVTVGLKRDGSYVVRRGFFYTHGKTVHDLISQVRRVLGPAGFDVNVINYGECWKPFKGGGSVTANSHWWVEFTVTRDKAANES
jgi:hypothetical protein